MLCGTLVTESSNEWLYLLSSSPIPTTLVRAFDEYMGNAMQLLVFLQNTIPMKL